jgi:hypothetical protein
MGLQKDQRGVPVAHLAAVPAGFDAVHQDPGSPPENRFRVQSFSSDKEGATLKQHSWISERGGKKGETSFQKKRKEFQCW